MMITAHSGADGTPDNSLDFVRYALTVGADAFEVDVHRRADGELVIAHDTDGSGTYFGCPTLREVFALAAGNPTLGVNCDLKDAGLERATIALHNACGGKNPLYFSGTVSPALMQDEPALFGNVTVLLNAEELVENFYPRMLAGDHAACAEACAKACAACGAKVVNVYYWCCPVPFFETLRAHGIGVSVWTVNEADEAQYFAAQGVFNITTRIPKKLVQTLRR